MDMSQKLSRMNEMDFLLTLASLSEQEICFLFLSTLVCIVVTYGIANSVEIVRYFDGNAQLVDTGDVIFNM